MSFFDKLRKGVANIETEVKKLKELTEDGPQISEEQLRDNLVKAKTFDSDVRQTYSEVTQLLNSIKSSGDLLNESKNQILAIKQRICDIEDNSGLQKFGYKPFTEKYSIETMDDNVFIEEEEVVEPIDDKEDNENIMDAKSLAEEFECKSNIREERTTQTVRFAPEKPVVNSWNGSNDRPKVETKQIEKKERMIKKYDKLLTRTPQPKDFGITKRFTLLPQIYNNSIKRNAKITPEEPPESTQTYRFNYINNGFHLGSTVDPLTPPNHSNNNNADSFVTVEFTPGLTTKRPKGVSRVQNNSNNNNLNKTYNQLSKANDVKPSKQWADTTKSHRLPQSILQSVENDKITPEQPIPVTDKAKSAHILRSIVGKTSGTPPLPKSRIDTDFHNQILKHL